MKVQKLSIADIRSFDGRTDLSFSPGINLLVGPNSSGKSTIIYSLTVLQTDDGNLSFPPHDLLVRLGKKEGYFEYEFDEMEARFQAVAGSAISVGAKNKGFRIALTSQGGRTSHLVSGGNIASTFGLNSVLKAVEPNNLFYLFLSRRKGEGFQEAVNEAAQRGVKPNFQFLIAKIDRLSISSHPRSKRFEGFLNRVLGLQLSTIGTAQGKAAGAYVGDDGEAFIRLQHMGEGVAHIAALLADLAVAKDKIFLIEELENDIHPTALIQLLDIIQECSLTNQFIISTHSHIVLSRLGATENSKVFGFSVKHAAGLPTTTVKEIPPSLESRLQLLRDLGYDSIDLGHWAGYLILEESTAEAIIRDFLIPAFTPALHGRLRTIDAKGVAAVEKSFDSLMRLFLFLHLAPAYRGKTWVRIDGGKTGEDMADKLRRKFGVSDPTTIATFSHQDFELYYPDRFRIRALEVLAMPKGEQRQKAKGQLCREVLSWADAERETAVNEFSKSAAEIIEELRKIAASLT